MTMPGRAKLPSYLKPANRLIVWLQRLGISIGTIRVLAIPGRASGTLRATPVSPLTVAGRQYVVGGLGEEADWVKNARASGWGVLGRGRHRQRVTLVEVPVEERAAVLRAFPREVPHGVGFFTAVHGVTADPEQFVALAPRCPVFRLEPDPR
jgi:hypothetical protein